MSSHRMIKNKAVKHKTSACFARGTVCFLCENDRPSILLFHLICVKWLELISYTIPFPCLSSLAYCSAQLIFNIARNAMQKASFLWPESLHSPRARGTLFGQSTSIQNCSECTLTNQRSSGRAKTVLPKAVFHANDQTTATKKNVPMESLLMESFFYGFRPFLIEPKCRVLNRPFNEHRLLIHTSSNTHGPQSSEHHRCVYTQTPMWGSGKSLPPNIQTHR